MLKETLHAWGLGGLSVVEGGRKQFPIVALFCRPFTDSLHAEESLKIWQIPGLSTPTSFSQNTFSASVEFNIGLGIHYDLNTISVAPTATMVNPGHRGPDALLHPPGARTLVHLF